MKVVPTREDINPFGDLDGERAERDLLGKPVEGMLELLRENSVHFQVHYMWMGPRAFVFYFPAATQYLRSEAATGDSCFVSCMCTNLKFRLTYDRNEIRPSFPQIEEFVESVLADFARFDLGDDMRGHCREILEKMGPEPEGTNERQCLPHQSSRHP